MKSTPKVTFPDTGIYAKVLREAERKGNLIGAPKFNNQEVQRNDPLDRSGNRYVYNDWRNW